MEKLNIRETIHYFSDDTMNKPAQALLKKTACTGDLPNS